MLRMDPGPRACEASALPLSCTPAQLFFLRLDGISVLWTGQVCVSSHPWDDSRVVVQSAVVNVGGHVWVQDWPLWGGAQREKGVASGGVPGRRGSGGEWRATGLLLPLQWGWIFSVSEVTWVP